MCIPFHKDDEEMMAPAPAPKKKKTEQTRLNRPAFRQKVVKSLDALVEIQQQRNDIMRQLLEK